MIGCIHGFVDEFIVRSHSHPSSCQHDDFRRFLHRAATNIGAKVRFNTRVNSIDPDRRTVTLSTGEILRAHVIIGADGPNGITRQYFPDPDVFDGDPGTMKMYQCVHHRNAARPEY